MKCEQKKKILTTNELRRRFIDVLRLNGNILPKMLCYRMLVGLVVVAQCGTFQHIEQHFSPKLLLSDAIDGPFSHYFIFFAFILFFYVDVLCAAQRIFSPFVDGKVNVQEAQHNEFKLVNSIWGSCSCLRIVLFIGFAIELNLIAANADIQSFTFKPQQPKITNNIPHLHIFRQMK